MAGKIGKFEELVAWQKARELSVAVYRITGSGLFAKDFGLRDQTRRASVSVMSNIAEGFERYSRSEFKHFLVIAPGSVAEVRSQLHLARALGYVSEPQFTTLYNLCIDVSRLVGSLRASLDKA